MDLTFKMPEVAGVTSYGVTETEAIAKVEALAFRVSAEQLKYGRSCA